MADQQIITETEIWKPIPGFPGYDISNYGNVVSYRNNYGRIDRDGHLIKPSIKRKYKVVQLSKDGRKWHIAIHRLVLLAFYGPCPKGLECCHNDGNPLNNHISNLRWDTISSNRIDRIKHGYKPLVGEKNGSSKLTEKEVIEIRHLLSIGKKGSEIAVLFNICSSTVCQIKKRLRWKYLP
jgi:hypothetical protein